MHNFVRPSYQLQISGLALSRLHLNVAVVAHHRAVVVFWSPVNLLVVRFCVLQVEFPIFPIFLLFLH